MGILQFNIISIFITLYFKTCNTEVCRYVMYIITQTQTYGYFRLPEQSPIKRIRCLNLYSIPTSLNVNTTKHKDFFLKFKLM